MAQPASKRILTESRMGVDIHRIVTPEQFGYTGTNLTADTAAMQSALNAAALVSGTLSLGPRAYRTKAVTLAYDTSFTGFTPPQTPVKIEGAGSLYVGLYEGLRTTGARAATTWEFTGKDANGYLKTLGTGFAEILGIHFFQDDDATDATPFILTTNTTVDIHHNSFSGHPSLDHAACIQDPIVFGGTLRRYGAAPSHAFGGYGSRWHHNYFTRIRSVRYNVWAESLVSEYNMWDTLCGGEAAVVQDPTSTLGTSADGGNANASDIAHISGNIFNHNRFSAGGYKYAIRSVDQTLNTMVLFPEVWDVHAGTQWVAMCRAEKVGTGVPDFQIIGGFGYDTTNWLSEGTGAPYDVSIAHIKNYRYGTERKVQNRDLYEGSGVGITVKGGADLNLQDSGVASSILAHFGRQGTGTLFKWQFSLSSDGTRIQLLGTNPTNGVTSTFDPRDGYTTTGWVRSAGSALAITRKSTAYNLTSLDSTVLVDTAGITVNLTNANAGVGRLYTVKNISTGTVTVGSAGGTIDGAATRTLAAGAAERYQSDGTNWWVI